MINERTDIKQGRLESTERNVSHRVLMKYITAVHDTEWTTHI